MAPPAFWTHFESLEDPRVERTRRHQLIDIVVVSVLAVIAGADGWTDIALYGRTKEAWLRTFLELPNGIPCDDTFRRVWTALDPGQMQACFVRWTQSLAGGADGKLIAIDGKTVRHSFANETGQKPLHLVSAWVDENRMVLGQVATAAKSNEITAIPELLDLVDVKGATVTIDAMGCQKKIAERIVDGGGDYVLAVKDNQPTLHEEIREFFELAGGDAARDTYCQQSESVDGGHGRIETRRVTATAELDWLVDKPAWKGLRSIVMVESERTVGDTTSTERRYYLTTLPPNATLIGERIRGHWGIENQLHWVLDMAFDEDRCRIRRGHAPDNFALLRKIALNLLRLETSCKKGLERKRRLAGWDDAYLLKVLQATSKLAT